MNLMRFGFYPTQHPRRTPTSSFGAIAVAPPPHPLSALQAPLVAGAMGFVGHGASTPGLLHPHLLSPGFTPSVHSLTLAERLAGEREKGFLN